jgi:hypothetical protein
MFLTRSENSVEEETHTVQNIIAYVWAHNGKDELEEGGYA